MTISWARLRLDFFLVYSSLSLVFLVPFSSAVSSSAAEKGKEGKEKNEVEREKENKSTLSKEQNCHLQA